MAEPRWSRWAAFGVACSLLVGCGGKERTGTNEHAVDTHSAVPGSSSVMVDAGATGPSVASGGATASDASAGAATTSDANTSTAEKCPIIGQRAPVGSSCNLLGDWTLHSAPWNGMSTDAKITFCAAGTLIGDPAFTGRWSLAGSALAIWATEGEDMTCKYEDDWTLTFSDDCQTAPLVPVGSGCTGARRYLDWDVTMTRP